MSETASQFAKDYTRLESLQATLTQRNRELSALYAITAAVSQSLVLQETLDNAIAKVLEVLGLDADEIRLLDSGTQELVLGSHKGLTADFISQERQIKVGDCLCGQAALSGETIAASDIARDLRAVKLNCRRDGFQSLAIIPLKSKDKLLGTMNLFSRDSRAFSPDEKGLLETIGRQIGVAIENAQLYDRVEPLAVLRERVRLAREIHDGLAQDLGYLSLKTRQIEELLRAQDVAGALRGLEEARQVIKQAYDDARESIDGLRIQVDSNVGLPQLLADYLADFSRQTQLTTDLTVEGDIQPSHLAQVGLLRIVQEGLTNVRKHARATEVRVTVKGDSETLAISIQDNGQGFDLSNRDPNDRRHVGLSVMQERAQDLGGDLIIQSAPGQGTVLTVNVPNKGKKQG